MSSKYLFPSPTTTRRVYLRFFRWAITLRYLSRLTVDSIFLSAKRLVLFLREGGNQDASAVRKDLTGWSIVSVAVAILLGFAGNALTATPPEFALAKKLFVAAMVIIFIKIVDYLANKRLPRATRMVLAFFLCGGVGLALTEVWHYIDQRNFQWQASAKPVTPKKEVIVQLPESMHVEDQASASDPKRKQVIQSALLSKAGPAPQMPHVSSFTSPTQIPASSPEPTAALPIGTMRTGVVETDAHKKMVLQRLALQYMMDTGKNGAPPVEWLKNRLSGLHANWSYYDEDYGFREIQVSDRLMADESIFATHMRLFSSLPIQITYPASQSLVARQLHEGLRSAEWNEISSKLEPDVPSRHSLLLSVPLKISDSQRATIRELVSELWNQGLPTEVKYDLSIKNTTLALPAEITNSGPITQEFIDMALRSEQCKYLAAHWPNEDETNSLLKEAFGIQVESFTSSQKFYLVLAASLNGQELDYRSVREYFIRAFKLDPMIGRGEATTMMTTAGKELLYGGFLSYDDNQNLQLSAKYRRRFLESH